MENIVETPKKIFRRVARAVAKADLIHHPNHETKGIEKKNYNMMASL